MTKKTSKSLTREQLAELETIAAMPDSSIDTSDAPEVLDWSGAKRGVFYRPIKQQLTLRLDADLVAWFKAHSKKGKGYQTRINQALRDYVQRQERSTSSSTVTAESKPASDDLTAEAVPGYEASASNLMKRALQIARSLSHTPLSSDHFMLALTLDQHARRLLGRVGDVTQVREVAMWRLAKNYSRANKASELTPLVTADLIDLTEKARKAAAGRYRLVDTNDFIDALPKVRGRLTYGSDQQVEEFSNAAFTTFVQNVMLSKAVDELSAQIRDVFNAQLAVALQNIDEKVLVKLIELRSADQVEVTREASNRAPRRSH